MSVMCHHIMAQIFFTPQRSRLRLCLNAINRSLCPLDFTLPSVCQVQIYSWEFDWAGHQTDMILQLLQPGWASVCEYHLVFFCFFFSYYQETLAGCLWVYSAFLFQPQRTHFIFAVTLLSLRLLHFVRPEKQPALCYQGKVHLFRVSSWDGFWASKFQRLFSTLPASLPFFSP